MSQAASSGAADSAEALPVGLLEKLLAARKDVEPVEKRGHNQDGDYAFAEAVDFVQEANRVLTKRSVLVLGSLDSTEQTYGKTGVLVKANMTFEVIDATSGKSIVRQWAGYGFDMPGDKAVYQAVTGANKYFLANLLSIPVVGADPEGDSGQTLAQQAQAAREAERIRRQQDRAAERPDSEPADLPAAA